MALEGSLKEFNVADILQLIFFQKKTGALVLQGRADRVRVLFHDGNIVGADSRKKNFEKRLVMTLRKRGVIAKEHIDATIEKQRAEGGKFLSVLVREGFAQKDEVLGLMTFLITEIMVQVFTMKEGRYEFKPQSIPLDKEVGVVLNTEHFLMEGVRLVDEWGEIGDRVNMDDVFYYDGLEPGQLGEEEKRVLGLVDNKNSISDISDVLGMDSFTVASHMLKLEDRGIVYRTTAEAEQDEAEATQREVRPIPGLTGMLYVILTASIVISAGALYVSKSSYKSYKAVERMSNIITRVEMEHYASGRYPASIKDTDPWGRPYVYSASSDNFTIQSIGPDGQPGTYDDIPPSK